MAGGWLVLLYTLILSIALTAVNQDNDDNKSASLMSFLNHFNQNRHHKTNPEGKQKARNFIKETFQDLGLITWPEEFKPDFPKVATGVNIVGMLPGTFAGSPNDKLFLIGSHYDTVSTTSHGTDDNGSGVVAMLQVAKQILTDFSKCTRSFSILFVAFDFEEWEGWSNNALNPQCACKDINCGSRAFVANFTRFYTGSLKSNGKLQGAVIMDTVMNYNNTPNSQVLPPNISQFASIIFNQIKADKFRGNFLSVIGRQLDDSALMNTFWYHYSQVKSALKNRTTMYAVSLPFRGQPSPNVQKVVGDFLRSDHVPFWNNRPSLSAIFLSDTANHRSYMKSCYHENCDNIDHVTPEMLQFLQKTSDTIMATANDVTKMSCPGTNQPQTTADCMEQWKIAVLAVGALSFGVFVTGAAFMFYLRRMNKADNSLVAQDHLQSFPNYNGDYIVKAIPTY